EALRKQQQERSLDDAPGFPLVPELRATPDVSEAERDNQRRWECFERCAGKLESDDRELIVGYCQGEQRIKIENRRTLAARLGVSTNALGIRACRIRNRLETCMQRCLSQS